MRMAMREVFKFLIVERIMPMSTTKAESTAIIIIGILSSVYTPKALDE